SSVVLPDGLETIEHEAFFGCNHLAIVVFPDSLVKIGDKAFHKCTLLKSVDIPDGLPTIVAKAFPENVQINVRKRSMRVSSETNGEGEQ
ncbi:MAG: leucine-rich repeat domain-containing protein, partial [Thermoguttaceae bacterium]|nr:leucine-rich repeat domain-containing protein [Thermoguttaceae bacterium]